MALSKLHPWILAARPKTLGAGFAPVVVGSAMAWHDGGFHPLAAVCALIGSLLIQIGANYANDYFDFAKGADTPGRIGPTRVTQAGLVTPRAMRWATIVVFAAAFLPGAYIVYRGGWPFVAIGLLCVLFAVLYSAGPFPLSYLGVADLFVLAFFGPVAVAGTYYVQALALPPDVIVAGLGPGLLSVALLTVNNLRDVDEDRAAGKRTLAVRFGRGYARAQYAACLFIAGFVLPIYFLVRADAPLFGLVPIVVMSRAIPAIRTAWTRTDGPSLNRTLGVTGQLLLLFSVFFSLGWVL